MGKNLFEGKRRHFSSGQKSPTATGWLHRIAAMLILVLGGMIAPEMAMALPSESWSMSNTGNDIKASDIQIKNLLKSEGYIEVVFPFYDWDGNHEFLEAYSSEQKSYIAIDNTPVVEMWSKTDGKNSGLGDWDPHGKQRDKQSTYACVFKQISDNAHILFDSGEIKEGFLDLKNNGCTNWAYYKTDGTKTKATLRIYPFEEVLKKSSFDLTVHLRVWYCNSTNYYVEKKEKCTYEKPKTPTFNVELSDTPNRMKLILTGKEGDKYEYGSPTDPNTVLKGTFDSNNGEVKQTSNVYQLTINYGATNTVGKPYVKYFHKISKWTTIGERLDITTNAFFMPDSLKAEKNELGNVVLSWKIPGCEDTEHQQQDDKTKWIVQRSTSEDFSSVKEIGQVQIGTGIAGPRGYDLTDDEIYDKNLSGTYYYRVGRSDGADKWEWKKGTYVSARIDVGTSHRYIESAKAELDTSGKKAIVTWEWDKGEQWTKDSKVVLVRYNDTRKRKEDDIEITDTADLRKQTYIDDIPAYCDVYKYTIYVEPGNENYKLQKEISVETPKDGIFTMERGFIQSLVASKGYYSDRISLNWTTDGGPINMFNIYSKEHNDKTALYSLVQQMDVNSASTSFLYSDEKAVSGIIYDYKVEPVHECGGNVIAGNSFYAKGFKSPTGDIYGRVTFESGQAEEGVEVRLEPADENFLKGKAYSFTGNGLLSVTNKELLSKDTVFSLQAWVSPWGGYGSVIKKDGKFDLCIEKDTIKFKVGKSVVSAPDALKKYQTNDASFVHIAAVKEATRLALYINGRQVASAACSGAVSTADGQLTLGGNGYGGIIDEVRLWNTALDSANNAKTYNCYLVGNEKGLVGYYPFDYSLSNEFYDLSYSGIKYNGNHGTATGVGLVDKVPTANQLSYRAYTGTDGSYTIRAIPYIGNGTAYSIVPSKGNHTFESARELRMLSANTQSHTVNFTDKSSFEVEGYVMYSGGEYPVEGVSFLIDGVRALNRSGLDIKTDDKGHFLINVPVGVHEVKAIKNGHEFEIDGRICNSDTTDMNYQDNIRGIKLYDRTMVKYIGRVCGGEVQEKYPVGFSLSKNNLADDIKVVLTPANTNYKLQNKPNSMTEYHEIPTSIKAKNRDVVADSTITEYSEKNITINVNNKTGEFVAYVLPIEYSSVSLKINGHNADDFNGNNSALNLATYKVETQEKYEYKDSLYANGIDSKEGYTNLQEFTDTIGYIQKQVFVLRYEPMMEVKQMSGSGSNLDYFGAKTYKTNSMDGTITTIPLYDTNAKKYTFGLPVFITNEKYSFKYNIYEEYPYYNSDGSVNSEKTDRVEITGARVTFNNKIAYSSELDTINQIYTFVANTPDFSTGTGNISADFECGDDANSTTIEWKNPINGYVFGSHIMGTDFVTGGPNSVLFVLRDPPGSNSYSYLEKGTSFTKKSTYTGSFNHDGSETWGTGVKTETTQINLTGSGVLTGTSFKLENTTMGLEFGTKQSAEYTGSNSMSTTVSFNDRFQTSSSPSYVGADADLYVGYSTNIAFGSSVSVTALDTALYNKAGGNAAFEATYLKSDDCAYAIVKNTGVSALEQFNTMFVYPQSFIENTLIPNLMELRKSLLIPIAEVDTSKMLDIARTKGENQYVSFVSPDDENFGQAGYYKVYYSVKKEKNPFTGKDILIACKSDTINYINQAIAGWQKAMSDNDSIKVNAKKLLQNYSFDGGSEVSYSESYSSNLSSTHSFSISIGITFENGYSSSLAFEHTNFKYNESFSTTQGGSWESSAVASHSKGFVLSEDGDDYLSVDVLYEDPDFDESYVSGVGSGEADSSKLKEKDFYPTFVFRTCGGATSCPYEDEYRAVHWRGHQNEIINKATKKVEMPSIDMPNRAVTNVPTGEKAFLTVQMKNNSETGADAWFDIRVLEESNPYGAVLEIDGTSMSGRPLEYRVPAGNILEKTISVSKGAVLNYDDLAVVLRSKCQSSIADTIRFKVHFIPSCTSVDIVQPSDKWTYNTKCDVVTIDGLEKHYMPIVLSGFDVNYPDFEHIELQYKTSAESDNDWKTLSYYYADTTLANNAVKNGFNAFAINPNDGGVITYNFFMDGLDDMRYDIRAVSFCNINNVLYENASEIVSGIKDMYVPRKFGSEKPADGVLTANDEVRLDFNETIAEGKLTVHCFNVEGVFNGLVSDHSVSVSLDGANDYMTTEATRNLAYKDLTFECSVLFGEPHNATFFSHGSGSKSIEMGMNQSGNIVVKIGGKTFVSATAPEWDPKPVWYHMALVYNNEAKTITAYVNGKAVIDGAKVDAYDGNGVVMVGRSADGTNYFKGQVDQFRIWNKVRTSNELNTNKSIRLSGSEVGLIACYDMDEAKGSVTEDKARGAHLLMKGCEWALPEGRSAEFNGKDNYIGIDGSEAITTKDMDLTLEFWFNAKSGAKSQTILSSGDGISNVGEDSSRVFSVGFNGDGKLSFRHNGIETVVKGNYADDNWHNFTLAVSRTSGHARIYMDGELNTYFDANSIAVISLDPVYVGARVWYNEKKALERTADQFFEGRVDELRFWNLYRQQSQVEAFYNQQTNGDEMGLKLYYPFEYYKEWQGVKSLQFTLRDSANKKENEADNIGGVVGSTNIPPVKSKGMTSYLNYSWVVNDDALIINLEEDAYRIEKTIVTFTVDRVEDVNGNPIASPISWSAYIDRNQLKWIDDAVSISKKQYADTTFKATMTNNGGSVINYSLENMPSWLSADKTSGSINPKSSKTVEFTVDPALAVGTYSEVVYLTNSDNTTEALTLDITVEGEKPEWKVNPSEFEYTMDVFAQIKIDGQYSSDKNDMIAAFDKSGKCVGVAHTSYNKTMDMWYTILTVYSNSSSNELSFRIWDASAGIMSEATPSSVNLKFEMNAVHGSPSSPVVFTNDEVRFQNIHLNKGWNWVSFNLKNSQMSENRDAYLANGEWGSNSIIKGLNTTYLNYSTVSMKWMESSPASQSNRLTLNNANMFKVYSDKEQVLSVSGSPVSLSSNPITAKAGWNYIAYLPSQSLTLKTALADYEAKEGDIIRSSSGFAMYFGHEWIGSLTFMQPNNGYMLKNTATAEKKFAYPANAGSLRSAFAVEAEPTEFESNMGVVAFVPEKEDGDIVKAVSADGESKSVVVKTAEGKSVEFITIAANNGAEIKFELERGGETYIANNVMRFASDAVYGTPGEPVILDFFSGRESLVVNPNPVEDVMNIRGGFAQDGEATIELFDIVGILVYRGEATVANSILDASINASGLTTGSYLLKVTIGDETSTVKVLKK